VSQPAGSPLQRPIAALLILLLLALAVALSAQRMQSQDYWWHLRSGQLVAESGAVPKVDPYTYTVAGSRWIDIHWLFQLGLWEVYRLGGHEGVALAKIASVLALVGLLVPIGWRRDRAWLSALALTLMLAVSWERFMPRPELPSFLLLAALLRLFDRFERTGDAWIYAVVPLQLLWVNVHGLFAVGVAVCAVHLAGELLLPAGQPGTPPRWPRIRRLAAVTTLAAFTAMLNPNGVEGALYPIAQLGMLGDPASRDFAIVELEPTLSAFEGLQLGLFGLLAMLSAAAIGLNWRKVRPSDLLLWVALFYLALAALRNASLFCIAAAPLLVRNGNAVLDQLRPSLRTSMVCSGAVAVAMALLTVDAARGAFPLRIGMVRTPGIGVDEIFHPVGAVEWIERHRPAGPIAHTMRDGGYLIWNLYPDYLAMSDGRLEVFGAERFRELQFDTVEGFVELDARYRFGVVIARHDVAGARELLHLLFQNPGIQLVHVDDIAALFVRRGATDAAGLPALDPATPGLFPPLDEVPALARWRFELRTVFYVAAGLPDLAVEVWEEGTRLFPDLGSADEFRRRLDAAFARPEPSD